MKEKVGPFRIDAMLGEGGIGRVYSALDEDLGRMVALKALRPEVSRDPGFVERFRSEAASLARLHHPNVTTLYSLHRDGSDAYMVMELVRGFTLEEVGARFKRLAPLPVRAVAAQVCAGLGYAHRMGVIHRDIKPSNLMLTEQGQIKIMDFGIARMRGTQRMTRAGSIVGTLAYMPPEQIKGQDNDERSDLYSLACVLYELLCGAPPFHADTEYDLIQAQIGSAPPPLRESSREIDPALESAVMRGLAKDPADRFANAADFARALGALALEGDAADIARDAIMARMPKQAAKATRVLSVSPPPEPAPKPTPERQRKRAGVKLPALVLGSLAAVLAAGIGAMFVLGPGGGPAVPAPPVVQASITPKIAVAASAQPPVIPRSETILPAPDAAAIEAQKLGANTLPSCPPADGSSAGVVRGRVSALSPEGWPQIEGTTLTLYGVRSLSASQQATLQSWLDAKGDELVCCAMPQGGNRCLTASSKQDVSLFVLMNGLAPAADGAPPRYTSAEQIARGAQRGVWQ